MSTMVQLSPHVGDTSHSPVDWERVVDSVTTAFRLTASEKERVREKPVAKLIAALPFLAHAESPERIAGRNLGAYLLSIHPATEPYYAPAPSDDADILRRLRPFTNMRAGLPQIVEKALALLSYHMLIDYERDVHEDAAKGQYNPVTAGAINTAELKEDYLAKWRSISCPEMDELMDPGTEGWWYIRR